ncbi:MAG: hypothetical protein EU539_06050 [Promethearchaeota archaeon]|nr:MAG: hypothetical protein EU539_06050 [Candidatus Lokiarchaeota archaeon]
MKRKVDDKAYLNYLLQSLNVKELKGICKEFEIKGYSRLVKAELIDFILDSLANEELTVLLKDKELEIVSKEIELALNKINGQDRESIESIKIVNPDRHEVEINFKGWNWDVTSYLAIRDDNIDDPERDCDCRVGSNLGFCNHFWVGFIFSLKQEYFKLEDWNLTRLPEDFEKNIESIILSATEEDDEEEGIKMLDKESEDFQFLEFEDQSITVHEGEIASLEKKEQEFQEYITVYYLAELKNAKFGPRIAKKSEFDEDKVKNVDKLNLRISEKLHDENDLQVGDKVTANGKLTKDNFLKMYIVKNIRKIEKI